MWFHQVDPVCDQKNQMIQFKSMKLEDIKSKEPNFQCWKDCEKHLVKYHLDMETHAIQAHDSSHWQKCWSSLWVYNFLVWWWIFDENQTNEKNNKVTANQRAKRKRKWSHGKSKWSNILDQFVVHCHLPSLLTKNHSVCQKVRVLVWTACATNTAVRWSCGTQNW